MTMKLVALARRKCRKGRWAALIAALVLALLSLEIRAGTPDIGIGTQVYRSMPIKDQGTSMHTIGLMEIYGWALDSDPVYHAAMKERDSGLEERAIGRAALLPKLSFQYQSGRNESEVTQPGLFGSNTTDRTYHSYSSSLTLEQPLIDYDAVSRYYRGVAQAQQADSRFRGRSQELAVRITKAYTEALYASDQVAMTQAQKRAYAEQMKINVRRLEVGEGTRTDMLETQARYDLAQAQEIEAQDNVDAAMHELSAMVGRRLSAQDLAPLTGQFTALPLEPSSFEAWRNIALRDNPELASLRYAQDAAEQQVEQARAGHLPKVNLYATAGSQKSSSESTYDQRYVTNSVGIQVSVPIFAGGGVSATVGQALDNSERLRFENEAKFNEVLNDLRKQFNMYNSSLAKMRAFQFAVNSAQELTVAMKKSVAGGERVNSDILDAEQQYYDALRNLAQARYAYLLSWLKLRFLAGRLSEVDVNTLAQYFYVPPVERNRRGG